MEAIYAHMVVTETRTAHYVKSEDLSLERHTGEYIGGMRLCLSNSVSALRYSLAFGSCHGPC